MENPGTGEPLRNVATQLFGWQLVLWPMVSVVLMAIGAFFVFRLPGIDQYVIWLATTVGIMFFSTIILVVADRRLANSVQETKGIYADSFQNIETTVRDFVEPSVSFQESETSLRMSLAPILEKFSKTPGDTHLHILGADTLAPTRERLEELKSGGVDDNEDEDEIRAEIVYGNAYQQIFQAASEKQVRRYIRLFTQQEIVGRTDKFQERYEKWLETQATFIQTMSNYSLVDTPRALTWGAPKSTMILGNTIAEIFFTPTGSTGGIILNSDKIVSATRKRLIDDYVNAPDVQPEPLNIYNKQSIIEFRARIEEIKYAIQHPTEFLPKTVEAVG